MLRRSSNVSRCCSNSSSNSSLHNSNNSSSSSNNNASLAVRLLVLEAAQRLCPQALAMRTTRKSASGVLPVPCQDLTHKRPHSTTPHVSQTRRPPLTKPSPASSLGLSGTDDRTLTQGLIHRRHYTDRTRDKARRTHSIGLHQWHNRVRTRPASLIPNADGWDQQHGGPAGFPSRTSAGLGTLRETRVSP